ncbi:hypothetical protein L6164_034871 [Bauhinia variegata]|uniref:Uncharacterized protein n=1 Tax=Bauhinia variegata TaxID=167791 RepID=A0ACB9KWK6_BAUVA|nr:hypothetical protein L6164_034871 [Bauhinia variegata]
MASDETMTLHSSLQDEDFDDDIDDGYDHGHDQHNTHHHNLSRLSVCTSSTLCGVDEEDDDVDNAMTMCVSRLSIESFEGGGEEADGEFSDGKENRSGLSSDSESELASCYSLPATPPRRRSRGGMGNQRSIPVKEYASDNEAQKSTLMGHKMVKNYLCRRRRSRRIRSNNWDNCEKNSNKHKKPEEEHYIHGFSGESDQSGCGGGCGGSGVMLLTRPKGGGRSLCMDLEEVKACRDLGFELEHERMLEMPSHLSLSNSTLDTSSGGNSPIANWRISSPGDDPRDVKARLKVWAQAVALASASKYGS